MLREGSQAGPAGPQGRERGLRTFIVGDVRVEALRGINLTVQAGEFLAIMGSLGLGEVDAHEYSWAASTCRRAAITS